MLSTHLHVTEPLHRRAVRLGTALLFPFLLWGGGSLSYTGFHRTPDGASLAAVALVGFTLTFICSAISTWGWSGHAWALQPPPWRYLISVAVSVLAFVDLC